MQFVDENSYDVLLEEETFVTKPDGSPLVVLLKNVVDLDTNSLAWSALKKLNPKTFNRSTAAGIESAPLKRADGSYSNSMVVPKGWDVISGTIGYFERTARFPYCHPCAWNQKNPEKMAALIPLVDRVSALYKQTLPEKWAFQKTFVDKTPKDYIIGDSIFTTLTINKNFRTSVHKDAGDLPGGFSCLSVIREGGYKGGNLVFPNYRIAANVQMGDLILFDPHEFHGNTQIVPTTPKAQRCSLVYYFREKMIHCMSPVEELQRVKNRKKGDKLYDVED